MSGHGHVTPNPDGSRARCGGPPLCVQCAREAAAEAGRFDAELNKPQRSMNDAHREEWVGRVISMQDDRGGNATLLKVAIRSSQGVEYHLDLPLDGSRFRERAAEIYRAKALSIVLEPHR